MASRNFHKRRTKERKERQRIELRDAERNVVRATLRRFQGMPISIDDPDYRPAPKMFVRGGKPTPFEYL